MIVLTGVLFFAFRNVQYAHATMFITLLVLLCFNLLGEGFEVALPRIIDTLIGCAIAWAVRVHCPVQHPRQVAEFPVRPDEADRCPGDGAADQRINDTRQRDFKALAKQVKAQQHSLIR